MLLGQNVYMTVAREYKIKRSYTVRARFEKCFLLCFFERCFLITSGKVRISHASYIAMRLYEIFWYSQILTVNNDLYKSFDFRDHGRWLL